MNTSMDFFLITDSDVRNAVWAWTTNQYVDLRKGIDSSVMFFRKKGNIWCDVITTGFSGIYLVSEKFRKVIIDNKLTGSDFIRIIIETGKGEKRDDYYFLKITGKCGDIDNTLSSKIEVTYRSGKKGYRFKGLLFSLETWDGNDIFSPSNYVSPIISSQAKKVLEESDLSNIEYHSINELVRDIIP